MSGLGWISFLIVGLIAGWIADKVMKRDHTLVMNLVVGVIGAYVAPSSSACSASPPPASSGRWWSRSSARWCCSRSWAR